MKTFWHIWKYPTLLAILTMIGLLSALLGTGWLHAVSWICLAIPLIVCIRFIIPNRKGTTR